MKISLIIPTRERAAYLGSAVRSALIAADRAGCEVEIVICDNASTDDTPDVIAGFSDPRILACRSPQRLSMRENFQYALSHATGSHLVFIGDDDAVLPNGLRLLASLIVAHDPDSVKWRVLNYLWPDALRNAPGQLKVRPQTLDGRVRWHAPRAILKTFEDATFRSYHDGGMIYHGCISRRLVDRVEQMTGGPYFRGLSPDVFTSVQALMVTDRPIPQINLPVTMGGASPRSNGASAKAAEKGQALVGTEYGSFIVESGSDPWKCRLPASCLSLAMDTLDCLECAAVLHKVDLKIDKAAWTRLLQQEIGGYAEPARSECVQLAREVFGLEVSIPPLGDTPVQQPIPTALPTPQSGPSLRRGVSKLVFSGGPAMESAMAAAGLLDCLVNLEAFSRPAQGRLAALGNVLRQHLVARSLLG
jgi:Glycosyl transferase family 2